MPDLIRRLNLITLSFSSSLYEELSLEPRKRKKKNKNWYLSKREVSYPFPISYYTSDNAYETRLIFNSAGKSHSCVSCHKGFRERLFRQLVATDGMQGYAILNLDFLQCHSRIAKEFISAPILTEMVQTEKM